ncbi:MAG: hypothetical protein LBT70_03080 [Holosporaceae bacterium]|nr:hypothetical protein [Holosporaceae bacterium]
MIKKFLNLIYNIHFVIFLAFTGSSLLLLRLIVCDEIGLHCNYPVTDYILYTVISVVTGIAFLIATFLRKKKALYADILEESVLYNISLLTSIAGVLAAVIYAIYLYFSEADKLQILNSSFGLIGMLSITSYLLMERKLLKAGRFVSYYLIIFMAVNLSVGGILGVVHKYAPLNVIKTLQKDKNIRNTVLKIVQNIQAKAAIPTDIPDILAAISKTDNQIKENISSGDIKYQKISDKKFSLSWKLYTDVNLAKNSKKLLQEYGYIINSPQDTSGRCLEEFSLDPAENQNKTHPEAEISEQSLEIPKPEPVPESPESPEAPAPSPETPEKSEPAPESPEAPAPETPEKSEPIPESPEAPEAPAPSPETPEKSELIPESPETPAPSPETPEKPEPAPESPEAPAPSPEIPEKSEPVPESPEAPAPSPEIPEE